MSVSNCRRFIRDICAAPTPQEERVHELSVTNDGAVGRATFQYEYVSDGRVVQWGHEHWNLAFADGEWLITDVVYSVRLPQVEPSPF